MYQKLLQLCQEAQSILITGPQSLDGDSIGACLALKDMILQKCTAKIDVSGIATHQYTHLNGLHDWLPDQGLRTNYDLAIVVDGDRFRLSPTVEVAFNQAKQTVLIDHHKSASTAPYTLAILDPAAVSTCSMIHEILIDWKCKLTRSIAEALYVGILFDTGGFQHSNTNAATLRLAASLMETGFDANNTYIKVVKEKRPQGWKLQSAMFQHSRILCDGHFHVSWISQQTLQELDCNSGDIEGLVNDLRCTKGVSFAALIVGKSDMLHKVSLRSNPTLLNTQGQSVEGVDCALLAQVLSTKGGGHTRAAGATLEMTLQESIEHVERLCSDALRKARS